MVGEEGGGELGVDGISVAIYFVCPNCHTVQALDFIEQGITFYTLLPLQISYQGFQGRPCSLKNFCALIQ